MIWKLLATIFFGPAFWLCVLLLQTGFLGVALYECWNQYSRGREIGWFVLGGLGFYTLRAFAWWCVILIAYIGSSFWWSKNAPAFSNGGKS